MQKIMFNDKFSLTQAVLEGRKTMTRRVIKAPKTMEGKSVYGFAVVKMPQSNEILEVLAMDEEGASINSIPPKYKPGEVVAVAQSYETIISEHKGREQIGVWANVVANRNAGCAGDTNKMYVRADLMPHQIRITNVRVERLQDISDEDCLREGVVRYTCNLYEFQGVCYSYEGDKNKMGTYETARKAFAGLIDKVSGKGTFESNPWVFVYEFELVR